MGCPEPTAARRGVSVRLLCTHPRFRVSQTADASPAVGPGPWEHTLLFAKDTSRQLRGALGWARPTRTSGWWPPGPSYVTATGSLCVAHTSGRAPPSWCAWNLMDVSAGETLSEKRAESSGKEEARALKTVGSVCHRQGGTPAGRAQPPDPGELSHADVGGPRGRGHANTRDGVVRRSSVKPSGRRPAPRTVHLCPRLRPAPGAQQSPVCMASTSRSLSQTPGDAQTAPASRSRSVSHTQGA